jgi:hypothetical protein
MLLLIAGASQCAAQTPPPGAPGGFPFATCETSPATNPWRMNYLGEGSFPKGPDSDPARPEQMRLGLRFAVYVDLNVPVDPSSCFKSDLHKLDFEAGEIC